MEWKHHVPTQVAEEGRPGTSIGTSWSASSVAIAVTTCNLHIYGHRQSSQLRPFASCDIAASHGHANLSMQVPGPADHWQLASVVSLFHQLVQTHCLVVVCTRIRLWLCNLYFLDHADASQLEPLLSHREEYNYYYYIMYKLHLSLGICVLCTI